MTDLQNINEPYSSRIRRIVEAAQDSRAPYVVFLPASTRSGAWMFRRVPRRPPEGVRDLIVFQAEGDRLRLMSRREVDALRRAPPALHS